MNDPTTHKKQLSVFAIIDRKDPNRAAYWMKIGSAFTNQDGSISLYLDAFPLGPHQKLQVREARPFDGPRPTRAEAGLSELAP
ncbi:hypothetical protein [Anaeromyxobacter paludicola]|uniref:Uncharacterized protein n=1 Tax=Anaeromyxobacter paludicola TaxID=2918171 RepID=A0ABN6NDV4_9BACT|nr:hypothetical protein [Anaeromyxobacter paludicola]BDG10458.1 hypothetical protein AMPC_35710 [Anaeromyxobacter paludicola]